MSELRKTVAGLIKSKELLEEELSTVKEAVSRATIKLSPRPQHKSRGGQLAATGQKSSASSGTGSGNGNTAQELHTMVERLHLLENERKVTSNPSCGLLVRSPCRHILAPIYILAAQTLLPTPTPFPLLFPSWRRGIESLASKTNTWYLIPSGFVMSKILLPQACMYPIYILRILIISNVRPRSTGTTEEDIWS